MSNLRNRVVASFLGMAIGDALGAPIEGIPWKKRKEIGRVEGYISNGDHPWNSRLIQGQWTDDTQLMLVVAESLIANGGRINMDDMAARHVAALTEAREKGLGWGRTTTLAVERLATGVHWNESGKNLGEKCGAGNGVAMKMVPIAAMLLASGISVKEMRPLLETVFQLACMTHATGVGIAAGAVQALALRYCLSGERLFDIKGSFQMLSDEIEKGLFWSYEFADFYDLPIDDWDSLVISVDQRFIRNAILFFSPRGVSCETLARIFRAKGFHAADSIPTVLAFFLRNPFSIETLFDVIHWSGDADSNGAMVGALLGALNGTRIFPQHLIDGLWQKERIVDTANQLCDVLGIE